MKNQYKDELRSIEMSEVRKDALTEALAKEIETVQGRANVIEMPKARRRRRMPLRVAAAVAACIALGGGAAYAASPYVSVPDAFDALFHGAPAKTEVMDSIGRPVGATATNDGVTITADAIIGDARTVSIVYSVTWEDGIPEIASDPDRALIMHGGSHVWGADGAAGSAYFYDDDPTDNTLHYVEQTFVDAYGGIIGRTCTVDFDEIVSAYAGTEEVSGQEAELVSVAVGGWGLRFTIDYYDTTVAFSSGQTITGGGSDFAITNVNLSPVSVTIEYDTGFRADANSGDYTGKVKLSCPCSIVMDDGSRVELDFSEFALTALPVDGGTQCKVSKTFNEVVDIDHVSYIEIGDFRAERIG